MIGLGRYIASLLLEYFSVSVHCMTFNVTLRSVLALDHYWELMTDSRTCVHFSSHLEPWPMSAVSGMLYEIQASGGMFTMCNVRSQLYNYSQMYRVCYEHRRYGNELWNHWGRTFHILWEEGAPGYYLLAYFVASVRNQSVIFRMYFKKICGQFTSME